MFHWSFQLPPNCWDNSYHDLLLFTITLTAHWIRQFIIISCCCYMSMETLWARQPVIRHFSLSQVSAQPTQIWPTNLLYIIIREVLKKKILVTRQKALWGGWPTVVTMALEDSNELGNPLSPNVNNTLLQTTQEFCTCIDIFTHVYCTSSINTCILSPQISLGSY